MPPVGVDELMKNLVAVDGALHIFGYGSLIWKPNFQYKRRTVGYINGYKRKFYQGTTTHRGTVEWPGRVATILKQLEGIVWGVSYEVRGVDDIREALAHLAEREMILGGYRFDCVKFFPYEGKHCKPQPYDVQVYIAEAGNDQYLGDAPIDLQAYQIAKATGFCGRNIEYVKKVAMFMLEEVPNGQDKDRHVFELVRRTEAFIYEEDDLSDSDKAKLPIKVAMPHRDNELDLLQNNHQLQQSQHQQDQQQQQQQSEQEPAVARRNRLYSDEYLRGIIL